MGYSNSVRIILAFLFVLLLSSWTHVASADEGYISAEISNKGLAFMKDLLIEKAETSLVPLELHKIEKGVKIPLIGRVHMEASNITIYKIHVTNSTVRIGESGIVIDVSGATANLTMNWSYSYSTWFVPIAISDKGEATVEVEGMEVGLTLGLKNEQGSLKLSLLECGCYVKDLSIHLDGGASWLYQGLVDAFQDNIGSAVEKAVSKKLEDAIEKIDPLLESLPKEVSINNIADLNVTFIGDPELSSSSLELEISGLFSVKDENDEIEVSRLQHERVQGPVFCEDPTRMVGISVHENVLQSASTVYFQANKMRGIVEKIPDQDLLNTAGWKYIVPQLYRMYPNKNMSLNVAVYSPPIIKVGERQVDATIPLDVIINVLDADQVLPVACISVVISAAAYPEISKNALGGSVKLKEFTMAQEWSKIGNFHMYLVQPFFSTLLRTVVLPYINLKLSQGFPLPLFHGYGLQNSQLILTNSRMVLCSDVASTEALHTPHWSPSIRPPRRRLCCPGCVRVFLEMEVESAVNLGEKRPAEDGGGGDGGGVTDGAPASKKARRNGVAGGALRSMRKVAEMVLVLSAMGKMRGGQVPTGVEKGIMAAARDKLAEVCELFPPKDVFPRDVFGAIIEDLGLNKTREPRLGARPPKISIAEKFLLSKRKMEKADELAPSAANLSQRLHGNPAAATESRATVPAGRSPHFPIPTGNFQPSPLYHVAGSNSTSIPYQLPTSEVRPVGASGLTSGHTGKDSTSVALTRIDRPHVRSDGKPNGPAPTSHVQAYQSGDRSSAKAPAWSVQSQSVPSTKTAVEKVSGQTITKMEGSTDPKSGVPSHSTPSKPIVAQTITGDQLGVHQHFEGPNTIQAPAPRNTHAEISKMVQMLLQPRVSEHPSWTPPSRDYMNKAIMCETCKVNTNEVDNVYVCDACEKAYHLTCLQINTAKGLQRGEWHCDKCLQLSNGKPLPPKYGKVLRHSSVPKVPSNAAATQSNLDKKTGPQGGKVTHQKMMPNGTPPIRSGPAGNTFSSHSHPMSVQKVESPGGIRQNTVVGKGMVDDRSSLSLHNSKQTSNTAFNPPAAAPVFNLREETLLESKLPPNSSVPMQQSLDKKRHEPSGGENLRNNLTAKYLKDDSGTVRSISAEISSTNTGHKDHEGPLPEYVNSVDWIGGILKIEEQKAFYKSCCINGLVYQVNDHVLIRFNHKVIPSKLQAMWEDTKEKVKWVTVNRCYFPSDLPEAVGRPCGLENNEVYESNATCNLRAGAIQGPCEVLPPSRFNEEKERRGNENLRPLFLCKWIYDESKGLFRDVNC
ncbi:OLC1v1022624C1 [Oldenlandia corymbosa var. corymbosa]|uniref:OLC1v1022624C1 n=1 Tax=Oldenlandia corymbosa var. corymbosa TaxID=529605 RepID=A0AAV1BYB1_OLDCO|nr:OLC1v1022624C1 [Oldenlandia corymbosa var. corymbosa]